MSKVKGTRPAASRSRKTPPPPPAKEAYARQADVSSILFGLVMVLAIIVAGAALMGGSMSRIGDRVSGTVDAVAAGLGFAVADVRLVGLDHDPRRASLVARVAVAGHRHRSAQCKLAMPLAAAL